MSEFIQAYGEIIVLLFGVIIASAGAVMHWKAEKLKATFSILYNMQSSPNYAKGVAVLSIIDSANNRLTGESIANSFIMRNKKITKIEEKEIAYANDIFSYLNLLEQISLGISEKIYDERTCKKMIHSKVIKCWKVAESFIKKNRERQPTIYQELEFLVTKWEKKPLQKNR